MEASRKLWRVLTFQAKLFQKLSGALCWLKVSSLLHAKCCNICRYKHLDDFSWWKYTMTHVSVTRIYFYPYRSILHEARNWPLKSIIIMYNVEAIFRWTKLLIFHSYQKTFLGLFQKQHTHSVIEKPLCSNLQKVHYFLFPQIHW